MYYNTFARYKDVDERKANIIPGSWDPCSHLFLSDQQYTSNFIMQKWMRGRYSDSFAYAKQRAKMLRSVLMSCVNNVRNIFSTVIRSGIRSSSKIRKKIVSTSLKITVFQGIIIKELLRARLFSARIVFYSLNIAVKKKMSCRFSH